MTTYDAIVIGTGGVGSAAAFHLARRGSRVLGLDRFPGGHDRGSSHGQTRVIRMAYFEHVNYVPLLRRSYELWRDLEQCSGRQLFFPVGLLQIGPPDGLIVPGVLASAQQHGLSIESLNLAELRGRFPGFQLPPGCQAVFEQQAGYLLVEACVLTHLELARQHGAEFVHGQSVLGWSTGTDSVTVTTDQATYHARRLVITAGAWSAGLLSSLGIPLRVRRKHLHWYQTRGEQYRADRGGPTFFYEVPEGFFYGFPEIDTLGLKVAEHSGGQWIDNPLTDDRAVDSQDRRRVESFLERCLPHVSLTPTRHDVCYYTMSPDEHFLVGRHPQHSQVSFVAGLSGHGFKFTAVLGEILADLTMSGTTGHPVEFLSPRRFDPV